jgi:pectate lyase
MRLDTYGAFTVIIACILIASSALAFESSPIGWAAYPGDVSEPGSYVPGGTTGGAGGPTVTVRTWAELDFYASQPDPYIIQVDGTISGTGLDQIVITSNKTVVGLGYDATISGFSLKIGNSVVNDVSNVIVRNLNLVSVWQDALTIRRSHHIWIDHCNFYDAPDGLLDITEICDFITVSWCKFHYSSNTLLHRLACLVSSSDYEPDDIGKMRITWHHNWWAENCDQRMPSCRYGRIHIFNNYFTSSGNYYCINCRIDSELLVENNYFYRVRNPILFSNSPVEQAQLGVDHGHCLQRNNVFYQTSGSIYNSGTVFTPPYAYSPDAAANVPTIVQDGAGTGKIGPDRVKPVPSPLTWSMAPTALSSTQISMTATTATDAAGVEYMFLHTSMFGHDSAWQDSPVYVDTVRPSVTCTYKVMARDKSFNRNPTAWSAVASATTPAGPDYYAPTPDPMTWQNPPTATSISSVTMTATTALDENGVEYSFECTSGGGHNCGWQTNPTYTDTGLSNNTTYAYRVRARDKSASLNATAWSADANSTTFRYACPSPVAADVDHDCQVTFADLATLFAAWGMPPASPNAVVNGDFLTNVPPWQVYSFPTATGMMTAAYNEIEGSAPGSACLRRTDPNTVTNYHRFYQVFNVKTGYAYQLSGQWKGSLVGEDATAVGAANRNWVEAYVAFVTSSPDLVPADWGTVWYRKRYSQEPTLCQNVDPNGTWDWEAIGNSPYPPPLSTPNAPAGGFVTATAPYMVISINAAGYANSGSFSVFVDNIQVVETNPCHQSDITGDCALDGIDLYALAMQWLSCGRSPSGECWQ